MNPQCDNTNCEDTTKQTRQVKMKEEFEGATVNWCDDCINRDSDMIKSDEVSEDEPITHPLTCDECDNPATHQLEDVVYHYKIDNDGDFEDVGIAYARDDSTQLFCDDHYCDEA